MAIAKNAQLLLGCIVGTALLAACGIRFPVDTTNLDTTRFRTEVASSPERQPEPAPEPVTVWLLSDTFHTGMAFPYDWLAESGFIAPKGFGKPQYVLINWGNIDAYTKEGLRGPAQKLRVLLAPSPSVMEIIPFNWHIDKVCPNHQIWQRSTAREYGPALAHFLNQCVATEPSGEPVVVRPSTWGDGYQLESNYNYFVPRVCNVWSAQAIDSIGGKINPWLAVTAKGLVRQAEKPPNNFTLFSAGNTDDD